MDDGDEDETVRFSTQLRNHKGLSRDNGVIGKTKESTLNGTEIPENSRKFPF